MYTKEVVRQLVSARRDKSPTDGPTEGLTVDTPSYEVVAHDKKGEQ